MIALQIISVVYDHPVYLYHVTCRFDSHQLADSLTMNQQFAGGLYTIGGLDWSTGLVDWTTALTFFT